MHHGVDTAQVSPIVVSAKQLVDAIIETDVPSETKVNTPNREDDKPGPVLTGETGAPVQLPHSAYPHPRSRQGFLHFYGWMGVPMVFICLLSAIWTFMLAVIQQAPTPVANWLMETEVFDYGEFWLLPKPDDVLSVPATLLLVLFAVGYLGLVVLMAFPDKLLRVHTLSAAKVSAESRLGSFAGKVKGLQPPRRPSYLKRAIPTGWTKERFHFELTSPNGLVQHYYVRVVFSHGSFGTLGLIALICVEPIARSTQAYFSRSRHSRHISTTGSRSSSSSFTHRYCTSTGSSPAIATSAIGPTHISSSAVSSTGMSPPRYILPSVRLTIAPCGSYQLRLVLCRLRAAGSASVRVLQLRTRPCRLRSAARDASARTL
jgi:hypothetical protein